MIKPGKSQCSIIYWLSKSAAFSAKLAVLAITALITFDVLMRYFFNEPQLFVDELASFLLVLTVFGGQALTFQRGGHIQIDLLINHFSPATKNRIRFITLSIGIALMGVFVWKTFVSAIVAYREGLVSFVMLYPLWVPMLLIPLGLALMVLVMMANLIERLKSIKRGEALKSQEDLPNGRKSK